MRLNTFIASLCGLWIWSLKMIFSVETTTTYKTSLNGLLCLSSYINFMLKKENVPKKYVVKMNVVNINI